MGLMKRVIILFNVLPLSLPLSVCLGMFIAKISRGRTIRQFINGTLTAPVLYTFMWLVIFGGAGLRLEREAAGNGLCCPDSLGWFSSQAELNTTLNDR